MKKVLANYAQNKYLESQKLNSASGREVAGFDEVVSYDQSALDPEFYERNRHILEQDRGAGYWLWKPYVILKTLRQLDDGDLLFYSDSGAVFLTGIDSLLDKVDNEHGILLFTLEDFHTHKTWTKRDCFHYMGLDYEPFLSVNMILASFVVCVKTASNLDFFEEWLTYAQDARVLTDSSNECGLPNYPEFRDHRHDQSILSLLGRKYGIETVEDISQWGNDRRQADVPQIIDHTRDGR